MSHGEIPEQQLMIEWLPAPFSNPATRSLIIQRPHELVRRIIPDLTDDIPEQEPMRVDDFVHWVQQWMKEEINDRLWEFERSTFNKIAEGMRAQSVVMNQMYQHMSNVVSNLQRQMNDQRIITESGEMDWEATGPAIIITLPDIEAIVNTHIQQGYLHWKREETAPPPGPPGNNLPQGQPRPGLPFGHPPPPPPTNSGQGVGAPGEGQGLGGAFGGAGGEDGTGAAGGSGSGGGGAGGNGSAPAAGSGGDDDMSRALIALNAQVVALMQQLA